jgi:nicotinate-nucleotide pyrophosphorylase (carboxylating)
MIIPQLPDLSVDNDVLDLVKRALAEDAGDAGDVTTASLVPATAEGEAHIIARENCIVSGNAVAQTVFQQVDPTLKTQVLVADSEKAVAGDLVMRISGHSAAILIAERPALNFMQRMTGIATTTAEFVARAAETGMMILDTRKTTPCLRTIEKYAVLCGGGTNHRFGLFDRILIKDNHRNLWGQDGLGNAIKKGRASYPGIPIEIEVECVEELLDALSGKPDWIMLDNMSCELMKECVAVVDGRCKLEASGGITLDDIEAVSATGVDAVSLGCLTHSVMASDLSLEFV